MSRDDVVLAALFLYADKGPEFTVGDVAGKWRTTRHGVARIVGDKGRSLQAMEGYYAGRLLASLDWALKGRGSTPEKLFEFLELFLDEEGDVPRFPARAASIAALRGDCHVRLSGLIARGVADGSILPCDPDFAATFALRTIERFHTWRTSTLTPDMNEEGATPGIDVSAWQHFNQLNERNFWLHWIMLRRALGIHVETLREIQFSRRYRLDRHATVPELAS